MVKKIRSLKIENIFKLLVKTQLVLAIFGLLLYIVVLKGAFDNNAILVWSTALIMLGTLALVYFLRRILNHILQELLAEDLNLQKYQSYFEYAYQKVRRGLKKAYRQEVYMAEAQVLYFTGAYGEALARLGEISVQSAFRQRRQFFRLHILYYSALNYLHSGEFEAGEQTIEKLSSLKLGRKQRARQKRELDELRAVQSLFKGEQPVYFDSVQPKTHLERLSVTYYRGMNARLSGDEEKAHELFSAIVNENPDLFYVQEAKKYLKEFSHDG
ncbi:hypothetical protein AB3329_10525 [Streptococcus sp. H31]|uniref:hypothetical protein n=1 Tax=Streptococcus huangxiaojuni TaxID=3237239 RepID=UPI0034A26E67